MTDTGEFVLRLSCADSQGIVQAVSNQLYQAGCNIVDSQQFADIRGEHCSRRFFMRVHFEAPSRLAHATALQALFMPAQRRFGMDISLHGLARKPRLLLLVSKFGHCLNDLLFRWQAGQLPVDIVGVVSNHDVFAALVASYGIAFHHLPLAAGASQEAKQAQEAKIATLARSREADLIVLARYMQILSPWLCDAWKGKAINIHHSFLPSFKGAGPYAQAHARGVKLIGATAHFVTADLDEGPIIEQDVARVDHTQSPEALAAVGRDVESVVLARAVRWFVEHRVLVNGRKTVVFQ
jgi:formyltetrahydrofolate deformylase